MDQILAKTAMLQAISRFVLNSCAALTGSRIGKCEWNVFPLVFVSTDEYSAQKASVWKVRVTAYVSRLGQVCLSTRRLA